MTNHGFDITPVAPFRLDLTAWALKRREDNSWDRWDGETYRRLIVIGGTPVDVSVTQTGALDAPVLRVSLRTGDTTPMSDDTRDSTQQLVSRMLGAGRDLTGFYAVADADPTLGLLAGRMRGLKPPRYPTLFEALVNAITCQQITLTAGLRILQRLTDLCGPGIGDARGFPRPEDVAPISADQLRSIGYSRQKARAVMELTEVALEGGLTDATFEALSDSDAIDRLRALHGVGRWTAEYALLRGLGRTHIFPGDDVGVRRRLEEWLGLDERLDYAGVRDVLAPWRPYGGLVYLHLLVAGLMDGGHVGAENGVATGSRSAS